MTIGLFCDLRLILVSDRINPLFKYLQKIKSYPKCCYITQINILRQNHVPDLMLLDNICFHLKLHSTPTNGHWKTDSTAFLKWLRSEVTFYTEIVKAHLEMLLCVQYRVEMFYHWKYPAVTFCLNSFIYCLNLNIINISKILYKHKSQG